MSDEFRNEIATTVVFLRRDGEVLLAMKKRGFGAGRWNGAGGKIEEGETPEECAIRETKEELGITALELLKIADITFHERHNGVPATLHGDIYECLKWKGTPSETEEMAPSWFPISELPLHTMWPDDTFWLARVLAGEKLRCTFTLDDNDEVAESDIETVEGF